MIHVSVSEVAQYHTHDFYTPTCFVFYQEVIPGMTGHIHCVSFGDFISMVLFSVI